MPTDWSNLQIDQYADFSRTFTWVSGGIAVNLTGAAARMMVRQLPTDVTPLLSISTTPNASGFIVLGGAAGTILISIAKSATSALIPATGSVPNYDLIVDWPGGTSTEVLKGQVLALPTNTH
jgi:hypothetical protein